MSPDAHAAKSVLSSSEMCEAADRSVSTDWGAYATAYDLLTQHNPEYRAIMRDFEAFTTTIETPRVIYDVGGGTGNYTEIAARAWPSSDLRFIEPDVNMLKLAKSKLVAHEHVRYQNLSLKDIDPQVKADLVICVHALYTMPEQEQRLSDLHCLIRPGGWLYLVDLGRYMNIADWRSYLFSTLKKELGLAGALRVFWKGREIAKQNTAIFEAQKKGMYWTHTPAEIASSVIAAGFEITRQESVYRGYSDLLVCRAS